MKRGERVDWGGTEVCERCYRDRDSGWASPRNYTRYPNSGTRAVSDSRVGLVSDSGLGWCLTQNQDQDLFRDLDQYLTRDYDQCLTRGRGTVVKVIITYVNLCSARTVSSVPTDPW